MFKNASVQIKIKTDLGILRRVFFGCNIQFIRPIYKKPNDQLLYVNTKSNHLPQIIQLPTSTSNHLSNNSSSKQVFDISKGPYEKALRESEKVATKTLV